MKTVKIILAALAATLAASSCASKLEIAAPVESGKAITEITASLCDAKTALQADGKVFWNVGDEISLFYNKVGSKFTSTLTAPAATSQFTGSLTILVGSEGDKSETKGGLTGAEDYIWGVYPYNAANASDGSSVTGVIPATQIAKEGSFADGAYLTVGRSDTPVMGFYGVGGAMKIKLTRSDIKSVVVKGNKGESLAGTVQVEFVDGLPSVKKISSAATAITLEAPEGQALKADTDYYICMAPVNFTEGFEIIVTTSDNKIASKKSAVANEIKRHTIAVIPTFDSSLEFTQKYWSSATVIPYKAGTLAFEINPVTKKPELAIVENVSSSRGPVLYFSEIGGAPVTVTPEANVNNQYMALGINASGKAYVYTQNYTTKKGEIYSSSDKTAWTAEITAIDQTNAYWGNTIGFSGSEVFMMTSNNANAAVSKRNINITKFDGSAWTTGGAIPGRATSWSAYYPMLRSHNGVLYAFITNATAPSGMSIYKYQSSTWTEVKSFDMSSEAYSTFGYRVNEHQDLVIAPDGQFYFAISPQKPYRQAVVKYNPSEDTFVLIASAIEMTNDIAARSCRVGINPKTEDVYLVYRNESQCLCVSKLNDQTFDKWDAPEQLTYASAGDIEVRFNEDGKGYIVCTTADHIEVFSLL